MSCCYATQWSRHAKALSEVGEIVEIGKSLPIYFPMYTVPLQLLLQMTSVKPHEELAAEGSLVQFEDHMGKAAFVSHQWVSEIHPDPDCRQLRYLQDALRNIMSTLDYIPTDLVTNAFVPSVKGMSTRELRKTPLFLWYDYFSCPQLEHVVSQMPPDSVSFMGLPMQTYRTDSSRSNKLGRAIDSIPAYIARCSIFFVLCPVLESDGCILGPSTWAERGWCRAERCIRELGIKEVSYILIKSATNLEVVASPMTSIGGAPGEGMFTLKADHRKLGPILKRALKEKLLSCLQAQDLLGYRAVVNMQGVHLRGFNIEPVRDLVPGFQPLRDPDEVARFLFQNGFTSVSQVDRVGWRPLHYAAMNGDAVLIQGLLNQRANLNAKTKKQNPLAGIPPFISSLSIALFFRNNDAVRLLLGVKANTTSGLIAPIDIASMGNNPEGIRMLCASGPIPDRTGIFGFSAFEVACTFGSSAAMEELLCQRLLTDVSRGLQMAMIFRGGTTEMVHRLVELRADINWQWNEPFCTFHGIYNGLQSLKYRCGQKSISNMLAFHIYDATALMKALITGQYEGAAALIAHGAHLELQNSRRKSARDFAQELSVPQFLLEAFEGKPEACHKIVAAAVSNFTFEI